MRNKTFNLNADLKIKSFEDGELIISGLASTPVVDRDSDRIASKVWLNPNTLYNYKNNPIILHAHDTSDVIGLATEITVSDAGLHIVAKISKAAGKAYHLISEGILKTFSCGFMLKNGSYSEDTDIFEITDLELLEVSVVAIPSNTGSTFTSYVKSLTTEETKQLKQQFSNTSILGGENKKPKEKAIEDNPQEMENKIMTDKVKETNDNLQKQVESLTAGLSVLLDAQSKREANAKQAQKDAEVQAQKDAEVQAQKDAEKAATAAKTEKEATTAATKEAITLVGTGAEALIKDLEDKLKSQEDTIAVTMLKFQEDLDTKNAELIAMHKSKMNFDTAGKPIKVSEKDIDTAVMMAKMLGRKPSETKYGIDIMTKAIPAERAGVGGTDANPLGADGQSTPALPQGEHLSGMDQDWEHSFSTRIYDDIKSRLIMEPMFGNIPMNTASLTLPINPEAQYGEWISRAAFENPAARLGGVDNGSTGAAQKHTLTDITLIAHKLAAKEYIGYEEEEDTILPIVSVIREAIVTRMARTTDVAILRGTKGAAGTPAAGMDPFDGIATLGIASGATTTATTPDKSIDDLIAVRRKLANWGLNPADIIYVVSSDMYYDLLEDEKFQTMDKVGTHASLLSGQVGMVSGSPVVVSGEFAPTAAGAAKAVALNKSNFYIGTLRGLMTERDRDIVAQQNVIVSTRRLDFKQIIMGQGVSVLVGA